MTRTKVKRSYQFKEGDEINWLSSGNWYRVKKVSWDYGWIEFQLEGQHKPFTIWADVEHPYR